jgi:hypothetical protein
VSLLSLLLLLLLPLPLLRADVLRRSLDTSSRNDEISDRNDWVDSVTVRRRLPSSFTTEAKFAELCAGAERLLEAEEDGSEDASSSASVLADSELAAASSPLSVASSSLLLSAFELLALFGSDFGGTFAAPVTITSSDALLAKLPKLGKLAGNLRKYSAPKQSSSKNKTKPIFHRGVSPTFTRPRILADASCAASAATVRKRCKELGFSELAAPRIRRLSSSGSTLAVAGPLELLILLVGGGVGAGGGCADGVLGASGLKSKSKTSDCAAAGAGCTGDTPRRSTKSLI